MRENEPCTCTNLRRTAQDLTELYDRIMAPSGLKITQMVILRDLAYHSAPGMSITELAQEEGLDRTTMGRNLRVLEEAGFVAFSVGDDRREHVVQITPQGRQALTSSIPLWNKRKPTLSLPSAKRKSLCWSIC